MNESHVLNVSEKWCRKGAGKVLIVIIIIFPSPYLLEGRHGSPAG